jgi:hypothetical protein
MNSVMQLTVLTEEEVEAIHQATRRHPRAGGGR